MFFIRPQQRTQRKSEYVYTHHHRKIFNKNRKYNTRDAQRNANATKQGIFREEEKLSQANFTL